jgi:hypothetical protein
MKTNLSKQTKYFRKIYNKEILKFELVEIPLNWDNWYYVQIDASVRTTFLKYNCPLPKYAIIEELSRHTIINLFRETIRNTKDLLRWHEKYICIKSDLDIQAKCNSNEFEDNWIRYEFKLL